jgi:uncharacterized membrane protein
MLRTLTAHPTPATGVLLAAAHHGVRATFWIVGWIVILALIIGAVVYVTRRRRRLSEPDNPAFRQPQERRHDS